MLALHIPSLAIQWPQWRLAIIEDWLGRHLPNHQAATRSGLQLNHLPPAKQDGRWPVLDLVSGPIGSQPSRKRAGSVSSDPARLLERWKVVSCNLDKRMILLYGSGTPKNQIGYSKSKGLP